MKEKGNKAKRLSFQYKLIEVKKLSYFENNIEEYNLRPRINKNKTPFELNVQILINDSEGIIEIILKLIFYQIEDDKRIELFGIKTSHKFKIKNFKNVFPKNDKNEYLIPDQVIATFLGVSISGTRGMLVVLNTNQYYKDILLPLITPLDIIKSGNKKEIH